MKGTLPPLLLLAALLGFALWNGGRISDDTERWQEQLEQAGALAREGDWERASASLSGSYEDWSRSQGYLHMVSQHGAVDEAEDLYRRCRAFAAFHELPELQAELAALTRQLEELAEMERFSLRNVL